jgi:hypothetical protein
MVAHCTEVTGVRSTYLRTTAKDVVTLLGKSRWLRSNAKDVRVTKAMGSVSLAFACCVSARFSARYRVNQQSLSWPCLFRADQFSYGVVACREKRTAELLFDRDEIAALGSPFRSCSFMPGITQPWWSARRCWAVALPLAGPLPSGYGGCVPRP